MIQAVEPRGRPRELKDRAMTPPSPPAPTTNPDVDRPLHIGVDLRDMIDLQVTIGCMAAHMSDWCSAVLGPSGSSQCLHCS